MDKLRFNLHFFKRNGCDALFDGTSTSKPFKPFNHSDLLTIQTFQPFNLGKQLPQFRKKSGSVLTRTMDALFGRYVDQKNKAAINGRLCGRNPSIDF